MVYTDPKTKKNVGVLCDICGKVYIDKFVYYSAKFDCIQVDRNFGPRGIADIDKRYLDLDFCDNCFNQLKAKVMEAIKKREKQGDWSTTTTAPTKSIVHKQKMQ